MNYWTAVVGVRNSNWAWVKRPWLLLAGQLVEEPNWRRMLYLIEKTKQCEAHFKRGIWICKIGPEEIRKSKRHPLSVADGLKWSFFFTVGMEKISNAVVHICAHSWPWKITKSGDECNAISAEHESRFEWWLHMFTMKETILVMPR